MPDLGPAWTEEREQVFEDWRTRMLGIGYRILGSVTDAEDVTQDAWFRWAQADLSQVRRPEAFLTTIVTRLALDRLRRVKVRREVYPGPWLPEPLATGGDPQIEAERAESLSVAMLVVLESLSPLERATFVLREVFSLPYAEVAEILGRAEPAVRQLLRRARKQLEVGHVRYRTDPSTHTEAVRTFLSAVGSGDVDDLLAVLAPDVVVVSDGGGMAKAPRQPVVGRDKVARLMLGIAGRIPPGTTYGFETFNYQLGLVARVQGNATTAMAFTVVDGTIGSIHILANPAKLAALDNDQNPRVE